MQITGNNDTCEPAPPASERHAASPKCVPLGKPRSTKGWQPRDAAASEAFKVGVVQTLLGEGSWEPRSLDVIQTTIKDIAVSIPSTTAADRKAEVHKQSPELKAAYKKYRQSNNKADFNTWRKLRREHEACVERSLFKALELKHPLPRFSNKLPTVEYRGIPTTNRQEWQVGLTEFCREKFTDEVNVQDVQMDRYNNIMEIGQAWSALGYSKPSLPFSTLLRQRARLSAGKAPGSMVLSRK